jgi:hypothetical protein
MEHGTTPISEFHFNSTCLDGFVPAHRLFASFKCDGVQVSTDKTTGDVAAKSAKDEASRKVETQSPVALKRHA